MLTNTGTDITDPFWADCNLGSDEANFSEEKNRPSADVTSLAKLDDDPDLNNDGEDDSDGDDDADDEEN